MNKHIPIRTLASWLGVDPSSLRKRIKKDGQRKIKIPMQTPGGLQWVDAVSNDYARQLIALYKLGRDNQQLEKE